MVRVGVVAKMSETTAIARNRTSKGCSNLSFIKVDQKTATHPEVC